MKYNCSNEFDLQQIYKKLTSKHHASAVTVKACNFFSKQNELYLLQVQMEKIMTALRKNSKT